MVLTGRRLTPVAGRPFPTASNAGRSFLKVHARNEHVPDGIDGHVAKVELVSTGGAGQARLFFKSTLSVPASRISKASPWSDLPSRSIGEAENRPTSPS